jgi:hypothetical protein
VKLATELASRDDKTARWIGKDVLRDVQRPAVLKKVSTRAAKK